MVTTELKVPEIGCDGCVSSVKWVINQFPGVESVEASHTTKIITLTYDPSQVDLAAVEAALAKDGYPVQK